MVAEPDSRGRVRTEPSLFGPVECRVTRPLAQFGARLLDVRELVSERLERILGDRNQLDPVMKWRERTAPSRWKLERVPDGLDTGARFGDAVREMRAEYRRRSRAGEPIVQWS